MPLQVPEHFLRYYILAIDPSINNVGIAILEIDYLTGEILSIVAFTVITNKLTDQSGLDEDYHSERAIKLMKLRQVVTNFLEHVNPVEVACESPFFNRFSPMAYGSLTEVVGIIYTAILDHNVNTKFTTIPPLSAKKAVGARSVKNDTEKGKFEVRQAIMNNPEIMKALKDDINFLSEHALDAIAVGYTLVKMKGI